MASYGELNPFEIKEPEKGIGNSTTTFFDVDNEEEAFMFLLSLSEMVCTRLRSKQRYTRLVSISYKNSDFSYYSHQKKLSNFTDNTNDVYYCACELFRELWKKEPIRQIGVRVGDLVFNANYQISLFDCENKEKLQNVDKVIDIIRAKYGINSIFRAKFLDNNIKPIQGGVGEDNYILFGSKF